MSGKKLAILGSILVFLILIAFMRARREHPPRLREEVGLTRLVPEGFSKEKIAKVEIFVEQGPKVVLQKEEGTEKWRVKSRFNAPADAGRLTRFLTRIEGLEGEFRAKGASIFKDYGLKENALHLLLFQKGETRPYVHLLAGKHIGSSGFVRLAEAQSVYEIDTNMWAEVGVWGGPGSVNSPPSDYWVDKVIIRLRETEIKRIAMSWPHREAVFERVKGEKKTGSLPKKTDKKWTIAGVPSDKRLKPRGVEAIARLLTSLRGSSVIDPSLKSSKGLDRPAFRCEITMEGGQTHLILGSMPKPGGDGFLTVEGGDGTIYRLTNAQFMRLFKPAKDLFELQQPLGIASKDIESLMLKDPKGSIRLVKEAEGYRVQEEGPARDQELDKEKVKAIFERITRFKPADYVDGKIEDYGLKNPSHQILIRLKDGTEKALSFGTPSKAVKGRYMTVSGNPQILVIGEADFKKIFPSPRTLLKPRKPKE